MVALVKKGGDTTTRTEYYGLKPFELADELPALAKRQGQVTQIGHQRALSRVECAECDLKGVALVLEELGAVFKTARCEHCRESLVLRGRPHDLQGNGCWQHSLIHPSRRVFLFGWCGSAASCNPPAPSAATRARQPTIAPAIKPPDPSSPALMASGPAALTSEDSDAWTMTLLGADTVTAPCTVTPRAFVSPASLSLLSASAASTVAVLLPSPPESVTTASTFTLPWVTRSSTVQSGSKHWR
eukprot:scaffold8918_cov59-Phaeocystis_antarctica.AAC.4